MHADNNTLVEACWREWKGRILPLGPQTVNFMIILYYYHPCQRVTIINSHGWVPYDDTCIHK